MTDNDFYKMEKEKLENKIEMMKKRIKFLENLILHLKNKFINIANTVDKNPNLLSMVEYIIEFIDENIKQFISDQKDNSKFNNYLKKKISKDK